MTSPEDLPAADSAASETPAPKKRGRPRKNPVDGETAAPKKRGRPRKNPAPAEESFTAPAPSEESLVDTATATLDAYEREEPLPADDASSAPAGTPQPTGDAEEADHHEEANEEASSLPKGGAMGYESPSMPSNEEASSHSKGGTMGYGEMCSPLSISPSSTSPAEEWSPAVQDMDGNTYLAASSTPLDAPSGDEWQPSAAPRAGEPAPKPENPAPDNDTWQAEEAKRQAKEDQEWRPSGAASTAPSAPAPKQKGPVPYPADADPMVLAAAVQPSEVLKLALSGQRLSRFELRKLTRRERAYLRAVQHGATIDYATFVARGIATAQQANAKQAQGAQPAPKQEWRPSAAASAAAPTPPTPPRPQLPPVRVADLQKLDVKKLLESAKQLDLPDDLPSLHTHDVIYELLRHYARRGGAIITEGILEIMKDGNGFLRNAAANYHPSPEDAQVPVQLIRRLALRPGQLIVGPCKAPADNASPKNRWFVLTEVTSVNGIEPGLARRVIPFENQTPLFPDRRIVLETTPDSIEMRIVDLVSPVGFGQRGLIVAPPRTGKTVIMQKMANAITANYPDAELIILLIDERPEEVTDMQRTTKAHVISSTFDEPPEHHVQVADLVIEMARRKVEMGQDVVILLDSITRLARAYNTLAPTNGRILSGGVEATALQKPKRFFGSARNLENGGSLTIIATALVETGSRMDEVIFEEFKGTGNMELCLDRSLVDKRIFPAINIAKSGTRREELLVTDTLELQRSWVLRRAFGDGEAVSASVMEEFKTRLRRYPTNRGFLLGMQG